MQAARRRGPEGASDHVQRLRKVHSGPELNLQCTRSFQDYTARWCSIAPSASDNTIHSCVCAVRAGILDVHVMRKGGCTTELAARIMNTDERWATMHRQLGEEARLQESRAASAYLDFVEGQERPVAPSSATNNSDGTWPACLFTRGEGIFTAPSAKVLASLFLMLFDDIEPHLLQDIYSRDPGKFITADATFKIASRIKGNNINALFLLLGENGDVVSYGAVPAESKDAIAGLCAGLSRRLHRSGKLLELIDWCDDIGCGGAHDVSKHWLRVFFPGLRRAPRKDKFHGVDNICSSVTSTHHPLMKDFARRVGSILAHPHEPDVQHTVAALKASKKISEVEAETLVRLTDTYKSSIRTVGRAPEVINHELQQLLDSEATWVDSNGVPLFKQDKTGPHWRTTGTATAIRLVMECVRKRCYTDPLSPDEMYFLVEITLGGLRKYKKMSESARNEALHKQLNALLHLMSHSTPEHFGPRLLLRIVRHNRSCDVKAGKLSADAGGACRTKEETRLNALAARLLGVAARPFPDMPDEIELIDPNDGRFEPMGFDYANAQQKVKLMAAYAAALLEAEQQGATGVPLAVQLFATGGGGDEHMQVALESAALEAYRSQRSVAPQAEPLARMTAAHAHHQWQQLGLPRLVARAFPGPPGPLVPAVEDSTAAIAAAAATSAGERSAVQTAGSAQSVVGDTGAPPTRGGAAARTAGSALERGTKHVKHRRATLGSVPITELKTDAERDALASAMARAMQDHAPGSAGFLDAVALMFNTAYYRESIRSGDASLQMWGTLDAGTVKKLSQQAAQQAAEARRRTDWPLVEPGGGGQGQQVSVVGAQAQIGASMRAEN